MTIGLQLAIDFQDSAPTYDFSFDVKTGRMVFIDFAIFFKKSDRCYVRKIKASKIIKTFTYMPNSWLSISEI